MESPLSPCSSHSTPEPEPSQSDLHPTAPPSQPASSPNPSISVAPKTELGSLDLKPCSVEEFLDIDTSVYGRYEYVEGILVALPMSEEPHDNIARYLQNHGIARYFRGQTEYPPASQEGISIPRSPSSPGDPSPRRTIGRPDVIAAPPVSPPRINGLSPKSRRISHSIPDQVKAVVEVTSHNEKTDTDVKPGEYEKEGVKQLITVIRDVNCKDESKRDQRIEIRHRDPATSRWAPKQVFRGDTLANMGPFGTHKPSNIFNNPNASIPLDKLSEEMREREREAKEREKEAREARQREKEREREAKEARQREKEREREAKEREKEAREARKEAKQREREAKEVRQREKEANKREKEREKEARELRDKLDAVQCKKRRYRRVLKENVPDEVINISSGSPKSSKITSPDKKRTRRHD